ncbi:hypothetical protein AYJ54_13400 [Bradyrhizobium centrolobii]|uniref:Uncharacterized protein n=1 Tax=Bradyrhizobium centrolobii TaxID=1505087 RepID=A0A176YS66_9BRAD|nr:hypothetical protein AYJ54_13400 [Bradyrhizobium centrolobii]
MRQSQASFGIYAKEFGEGFERAGQRCYTRQRLDSILRDQFVLHRRQPEEIERSEVSRQHICSQRRERRDPTGTVIPIVIGPLFISSNINNQIVARGPHLDPIVLIASKNVAYRLRRLRLR